MRKKRVGFNGVLSYILGYLAMHIKGVPELARKPAKLIIFLYFLIPVMH